MPRGGGAIPFLVAQAQAPVPPPMPYAWPVPPALRSQTQEGVRYVSYAILLSVVASVLSLLLFVVLLPLIAQIVSAGPTGTLDPSIFGALATVVAASCGSLVVLLVVAILGLLGLFALHKGGPEFGPDQARSIDRGIIVLIVGIVVSLVGQGIVSAASFTGVSGITGGFAAAVTPLSAIGSIAFGALQALLVGLFLLWSVQRLAAPSSLWKAHLALALGMGSGIAGGSFALAVLATSGYPTLPDEVIPLLVVQQLLIEGLSLPSLAL